MSSGRYRWVFPIGFSAVTKASSLVAIVAVAGVISSLSAVFDVRDATTITVPTSIEEKMSSQIGDIRASVAQVKRDQAALAKPSNGEPTSAQLAALVSRLDAIEAREGRLEQAILTNPEKALAMPMLRRDLDAAKETNAQAIAAVKANVDQVYDLTKWFIGALAVGVFSLAIPNLLSRRKPDSAELEA